MFILPWVPPSSSRRQRVGDGKQSRLHLRSDKEFVIVNKERHGSSLTQKLTLWWPR